MNHREMDYRLARSRVPLVILAQPPAAIGPAKGSLDDPAAGKHLERPQFLRLVDQYQHPTAHRLDPADNGCRRAVGPDQLQPRESALGFSETSIERRSGL